MHWGIRGDELRAKENEEAGHKLCKRCDGTGNELYSMYRQCSKCGGSGKAWEKTNE